MPATAASPNPRPVNLVEKKGSKILALVASSMPEPVSRTSRQTYFHSFEPSLLKNTGIEKIHVYFQATNLFTITKYSGPDPELVPSLNVNGTGNNQNAAFGIDYGDR